MPTLQMRKLKSKAVNNLPDLTAQKWQSQDYPTPVYYTWFRLPLLPAPN